MALKQCDNCKFYDNDEYEVDGVTYPLTHGICRRFPPRRIDEDSSGFPVVEDSSWCGEYRPKNES